MAIPKEKYVPRNPIARPPATSAQRAKETADIEARAQARAIKEVPPAKKPAKAESFPNISIMDRADMDRARQRLEDIIIYAEQLEAIGAAKKEASEELFQIIRKYPEAVKLGGVRWGQMAGYYGGYKSRRTLSKTKLLENEVTLDQIEASMVEGKQYADIRVKDLSKPPKPRGGGGEGEDEDDG